MTHKSYIAYLLLLCFSVFLGHDLVPHDHSDVLLSPVAGNCPIEHNHPQGQDQQDGVNAEKHTGHCHAFNDVAFENTKAPLQNPVKSLVISLPADQEQLVPEEHPGLDSKEFTLHSPSCLPQADPGTRALRAPPAWS